MTARRISLEIERHIACRPDAVGAGMAPYQSAPPAAFRALLHELHDDGWEGLADPCTGALTRVLREPGEDRDAAVSVTSDVTSGVLETTLAPAVDLASVEGQQWDLDARLHELAERHGLFLWSFETPPATAPTREHYAIFHTYWRGEYALRRHRGEDHYWYAWTIGANPAIDVDVDEAIPFLNVLLRLTGVTLFLRRLGSVSGGAPAPDGRLTVRPWAIRSLWERSPYSQDAVRGQMMADGDIAGWAGYLKLLIELPLVMVTGPDHRPYRVEGDPSFAALAMEKPVAASMWSADGVPMPVGALTTDHLAAVQRQVCFSRLRWMFHEPLAACDLLLAVAAGEGEVRALLRSTLSKLYVEVRSDGCPPPGEELASTAMYVGLLERLPEIHELVVERTPYAFWCQLFEAAEHAPADAVIAGRRVPDVLAEILTIARDGLERRRLGEERLLKPLERVVETGVSPAEEALASFHAAGGGKAGVAALAERYATHSAVSPSPMDRRP